MCSYIPLSIPNFEGNESKYVNDALSQGWVSTGGTYITRFEQNLADFLQVEKAAACQSGTAAIHLALIECGVKPNDMVIVPTLTFIAAVNPVTYQHAVPVFMDCDDTLCLDPEKLRKFCENECMLSGDVLVHKKTENVVRAVVVVHVFGNLADMEAIMEIAQEYHLKVIEDATEALGTRYTAGRFQGMYAGTIGDFGAFSFNGNKIITTGGGGAVTAKEKKAVEHMQYLSTQAKDDPLFYVHDEIGYNYRMTNLQAALGAAQLEELPSFIQRKQKNYQMYYDLFHDFPAVKILEFRDHTDSNKWFYSLELDMSLIQGTLKEVIFKLQEQNIQTRAIWGLIHEQKPYTQNIAYEIEKAQYYSKCILNIPCSTQLTQTEISYVVTAIKKVLGEIMHG